MDRYEQPIVPQGALPPQGIQEARIYEGYKNAFPFADVSVANAECGRRGKAEPSDCPECEERVIIHCGECKVQVTGCMCTDTVIHGRDYAEKHRLVRPSTPQAKMNRAQRRLNARKRDGRLWTPDQIHRS